MNQIMRHINVQKKLEKQEESTKTTEEEEPHIILFLLQKRWLGHVDIDLREAFQCKTESVDGIAEHEMTETRRDDKWLADFAEDYTLGAYITHKSRRNQTRYIGYYN